MGEIRFVGTGETRGYPYLVCKKTLSGKFAQLIQHCLALKKNVQNISLVSLICAYVIVHFKRRNRRFSAWKYECLSVAHQS